MEVTLGRRLAAEVVGTAILVLFGAGSVVAALRMGGGELDYPGLWMVAIAFALAVAIAIYAFGTTSGAHINRGHAVARRDRPLSVGRGPGLRGCSAGRRRGWRGADRGGVRR
jgi:hypothetical protein